MHYSSRMKHLLIPLLLCATLPSCATDHDSGAKTFLKRSGKEWLTIGLNFGKRAAPIAKEEYDKLAPVEVTATK